MEQIWLTYIRRAEKTAIIHDGKKKVHFKFPDGNEMAEEYSMETNVLLRRAWKRNDFLHRENEWEVEVGDPETKYKQLETIGIQENCNNPYIVCRITKNNIEWRIRNLPYPIETYSVTADPENKCIIVRTSNKKYFKRIPVHDLARINVAPVQKNISFSHKFNTLIIAYKKPRELLEFEKTILEELKSVKVIKEPLMTLGL